MCARRRQPRAGTKVTVVELGWRVQGTVEDVADDGRSLTVLTDDGHLLEFALSKATGYFTGGGTQSGARLSFDD